MPGYSLESSNTLDVIFLIGFLMAALKKKMILEHALPMRLI